MTPIISVVVCTYNRSELLSNLLLTLSQQVLHQSKFEVLVIDNNSKDDTKQVVEGFVRQHPNFLYFVEKQQGLSHARNRGYKEAKGTYVAYLDDDCKAPPEYLLNADKFINTFSPDVFGGPYFSFYNTRKPAWYKDEYGSNSPHSDTIKMEGTPDGLHGGNLFFRKYILELSNGFDPAYGMKGNKSGYGEETFLMSHIKAIRPTTTFYFEPKVYVFHLVRANKMKWRWMIPSRFSQGRDTVRGLMKEGRKKPNFFLAFLGMIKVILSMLFAIFIFSHFRNKEKQPYIQQYFYETLFLHQILYFGMSYEEIIDSIRGKFC